MTWAEEQDKLTQEARLFLASPEVVFEELKKLSAGTKTSLLGRGDRLEAVLIKRNEPLINLGLATYGANKEVFASLYKHAVEPPEDEVDAKYREGLRIGCLSNTTLAAAHILFNFPNDIIGPQETARVLSQGTDAEASALIRNPSIGEELLEALYQRTGMFAQMSEKRWCDLVSYSSKNERLVTEEDYEDSPDMGFYRIQEAIFRLLEIAPLDRRWLRVLYALLDSVAPEQVATPDEIGQVLTRWATLDDRMSDGKVSEGYHTSLSLKDEFRCLVAALYGRGYVNNAFVIHGSPAAERLLRNLARRLDQEAPGVAASILEGLDEMLTVNRLKLPAKLRRSLACTNSIENMMGTVRRVCRNVKRWRNAAMALRWTAAGMMEAAKGFRRLKAYRLLPILRAALVAHATEHGATNEIEPQTDAA
jgi:hypothetical protein